jgi:hypothetical protein
MTCSYIYYYFCISIFAAIYMLIPSLIMRMVMFIVNAYIKLRLSRVRICLWYACAIIVYSCWCIHSIVNYLVELLATIARRHTARICEPGLTLYSCRIAFLLGTLFSEELLQRNDVVLLNFWKLYIPNWMGGFSRRYGKLSGLV